MSRKKIAIIGTIPPPIGGVSVHVQRLMEHIKVNGVEAVFLDYKRMGLWSLIKDSLRYRVVHIHISNPKLRFFMISLLRLFNKKVVVTYHGDIGRFGVLSNYLDTLGIRYAHRPIVLNEKSLELARRYNNRSVMISAFIAPLREEQLSPELAGQMDALRKQYNFIYTTNCSNYTLDKDGKEVYQILTLIDVFRDMPEMALVVSDPKNAYASLLKEKNIRVPDNVRFVDYGHSFMALLTKADGFIRYTTTDGDSLSVHEALFLGKAVIASEVVSRPAGVQLVALDISQLKQALQQRNLSQIVTYRNDAIYKLMGVYSSI